MNANQNDYINYHKARDMYEVYKSVTEENKIQKQNVQEPKNAIDKIEHDKLRNQYKMTSEELQIQEEVRKGTVAINNNLSTLLFHSKVESQKPDDKNTELPETQNAEIYLDGKKVEIPEIQQEV